MTTPFEVQMIRARQLEAGGEVLRAELLYRELSQLAPEDPEVQAALARLALLRGDASRAVSLLHRVAQTHPNEARYAVDHALALIEMGRQVEARDALRAFVRRMPEHPLPWLLLGQLEADLGQDARALQARFRAVTTAQRQGIWRDEATTPPGLLGAVAQAIEEVRERRREVLFGSYADLREEHGEAAVARIDRALQGYLREWDATPADPRQRPRFFYVPGVPHQPYHDPYLQPWAPRMREAFPSMREEALRVWSEDRQLPDFLQLTDKSRMPEFLGGDAAVPAWEAFFFYRHGRRYEENHARCPSTSALLESIELCRIDAHAPEICFSVLKPQTHIKPHYGVSNVRLVMHLPLIVPPACALNIVDGGEHAWKEGELMMFDDTFLHEAWNRSDQVRIILLMDCWNPHLAPVERTAARQLIETIGAYQMAGRGKAATPDHWKG